ncbi:MAG: histidinol-phosphate transaminase [Sporichthyaceae bacterium]|nr:histidinol-phosphate transaminase [Sporichthyaceae bacterium]
MTAADLLPAGLLRPELRGRSPYGAPQLDVPVRLNTNENPHPPPQAMVAELAAEVATTAARLNRYPDRDARELRADLAGYLGHGLSTDQVWAANGSNEIIQQVLQAFGGPDRIALGFEPSYSMHPLIAASTGTRWVAARRTGPSFGLTAPDVAAAIREADPAVVFLTTPNNPTGGATPLTLLQVALETTNGIVVVDEAYQEFAGPRIASALALLPNYPNLVVTRTMSKAFAMAGARVGYLAAAVPVVRALQLVRLPYHLSALTQVTARVAVRHVDALLGTVAAVRAERDRLVAELTERDVTVLPSQANFVLFGGLADSQAVWRRLVEHGVLVRDVGLPGWLRVTAGLPAEVDAFLAALGIVLTEVG